MPKTKTKSVRLTIKEIQQLNEKAKAQNTDPATLLKQIVKSYLNPNLQSALVNTQTAKGEIMICPDLSKNTKPYPVYCDISVCATCPTTTKDNCMSYGAYESEKRLAAFKNQINTKTKGDVKNRIKTV